MTHQPYTPNERIIDRAVALWKRALAAPVYCNERPNAATLPNVMAGMLASMTPKNNTRDVLDKFGAALKEQLMRECGGLSDPGYHYYHRHLDVDYGPDQLLRDAAAAAGLSMDFPWKTHMNINHDCLSFSMGYGAPNVYHYPLDNDRWLVTCLCGADMRKVIDQVEGRNPHALTELIESAQ